MQNADTFSSGSRQCHRSRTAPEANERPASLIALFRGREKRAVGEKFGLTNFGVNLTSLGPGARSAHRHAHSRQDEFIFVLKGHPTLVTDSGKSALAPGMCAGFRAGRCNAHCLINDTSERVVYLEVGDRSLGDEVTYPEEDLKAVFSPGSRQYFHKDGTPR